ncbi:MAG TPA: glycoside hydrolase family 32 protein [Paenibacillus sp.]|nr:glycoside hydrolase family 32 protein [Paenibacillus sp.]
MIAHTTYEETYRPQFHFSPASGWMNDPNGMVYYEGEYHLFYQYHPHSNMWGPMHWGHAVSRDLVRWEHCPIALKPDRLGTIFSGSAVVDRDDTTGFFGGGSGLVAMFTQHAAEADGAVRQRQSLAYSADRGRTWTMYAGNPVLEDRRFADFRDPKVFRDEARDRWCMALAAGDRVMIYHSPNLIDWTFASEFGADEGSHDGVWECPDLFELSVDGDASRKKWVLLVSIGAHPDHPEGSRTQYFVGDFDGERFVSDAPPDTVLWLDRGRDNYAGVTWSDIPASDGRRLFIGWMSNWMYADKTPTEGWRSAMTLPRELTLRASEDGARLFQTPVRELRSLRETALRLEDVRLDPTTNDPLHSLSLDRFELEAEFELGDAESFGFVVRAGGGEATTIGYDAARQCVFVDRRASGDTSFHERFPCRHESRLPPRDGRIKLRLFVDRSSVELFANDGELVATDLVFPGPESRGIGLFARGGSVRAISVTAYRLATIW